MKSIAFIPARGGSKRLPGKNIRPFLGKPLIYYTIQLAIKSGLFTKIIVSTDNETIAKIAKEFGATVIHRPAALAGDFTPTALAAQHTYEQLSNHEKESITSFVTLQITNPLRTLEMLENAITTFENGTFDSVIAVSQSPHKFGIIKENLYRPFYKLGQRGQDIRPFIFENGLFYVTDPRLIAKGEIFGENIFPYIVEGIWGQIDIDTQIEFELVEFIYQKNFHLFNLD